MDKISAKIEIDKDRILNEIAKRTSYIGMKQKDPEVYDTIFTTDEDAEYFEYIFNLAHSECEEMLYSFTKKDVTAKVETETKTETDIDTDMSFPTIIEPSGEDVKKADHNIELSLPKHFSQTTVTYLNNLTNEYIIGRMMAEWIMITNPEMHAYWIERYTRIKRQISIALMARTKPLRRMQSPF